MKTLLLSIMMVFSIHAMAEVVEIERDFKGRIKVTGCEHNEFQNIKYDWKTKILETMCRPKLCFLKGKSQSTFLGFGISDSFEVYLEDVPYSLQTPRPSDENYLGVIKLPGSTRRQENIDLMKVELRRRFIDKGICKKGYYNSGSRIPGYKKVYVQ